MQKNEQLQPTESYNHVIPNDTVLLPKFGAKINIDYMFMLEPCQYIFRGKYSTFQLCMHSIPLHSNLHVTVPLRKFNNLAWYQIIRGTKVLEEIQYVIIIITSRIIKLRCFRAKFICSIKEFKLQIQQAHQVNQECI